MPDLLAVFREYAQFGRAVPAALILVLLWSWETLRPFAVGRRGRLRHASRNLGMAAVNGLVLFFTLGLATTLVAAWTAESQIGLLPYTGLEYGWRLLFGFLILDAWAYLWHRANHRIALLWRFHRIHHNDFAMDCTTSARFHFGELAIAATTRLPVIAAFGLEPLTILVHEAALVAVSQFHHANIALGRWDRPLRWLIATPQHHRVHHSSRLPETNSNYASILSVWDRLGRTFRTPAPLEKSELGLAGFRAARWHTVSGMLMTPLAEELGTPLDPVPPRG